MNSLRYLSCAVVAAMTLATVPRAQSAPATGDQFIETAPNVRIHVIVAGQKSARPDLVLVPGWRLTAPIWREQISAFSGDRRVIAVDPRSQGESTKTADGDTPEDRARDLRAILVALKADRVVLVAWSQGVQDTAAYVNQFGVDRLAGIELVDSPISGGAAAAVDNPAAVVRTLGAISRDQHEPRAWVEGLMGSITHHPLKPAELQVLVDQGLKTPSAIASAMLADDLLGPDRRAAISKMTVPTVVVASALSPELAAQKAMAAQLPRGRFIAIEDAGHAVFLDQPERFDLQLRDFLAGLG